MPSTRWAAISGACQYAADGWRYHAACRTPKAAGKTARIEGDIRRHRLDVTDGKAVRGLAEKFGGEAIDLSVNDAGLYGPRPSGLGDLDYDAWAEVMNVNVTGAAPMAESFVEHVAGSDRLQASHRMLGAGHATDKACGGSAIPLRILVIFGPRRTIVGGFWRERRPVVAAGPEPQRVGHEPSLTAYTA